jgi:hypothetical protein
MEDLVKNRSLAQEQLKNIGLEDTKALMRLLAQRDLAAEKISNNSKEEEPVSAT